MQKSPLEALISLKEQDVTQVVVFPTHVIDGIENNQMKNAVEECRHLFDKIVVAEHFWQMLMIIQMLPRLCGSR